MVSINRAFKMKLGLNGFMLWGHSDGTNGTITTKVYSCMLLFLCHASSRLSLIHRQPLFCCMLLQDSFHYLEFYIYQVISILFGLVSFSECDYFNILQCSLLVHTK